jgi:hypothetical protein
MTVSTIDRKQIIDVAVAQARDARNILHQRQRSLLHFGGHGETDASTHDVVRDRGASHRGDHPVLHETYPGLARSLQLRRQR